MKIQLLIFFSFTFLMSCQSKVNESDLKRDAEQLAMDLCHTQWVETKLQQVEQKIIRLQDSLNLETVSEIALKCIAHSIK